MDPAEALARARWDEDLDPEHPWYVAWEDVQLTLRQGLIEDAEADIAMLEKIGFRLEATDES